MLDLGDDAVTQLGHRRGQVREHVVVVVRPFLEAPLQALGVVVRGVRRGLRAEQVERHAEVEVQVLLQCREVDAAIRPDVVGVVLFHELDRTLDDTPDAGGAHEHVVRLFLEHEVARA